MLCGLLGWIAAVVVHSAEQISAADVSMCTEEDRYRDLMTHRHFELSAAVNCRTSWKYNRLLFTIINSEWSHASQTVKTVMIAGLAQK